MTTNRMFSKEIEKLKEAGLRVTKQRIAVANIIFENKNHHFTAESLYKESLKKNCRLSMATIYNTLRNFTEANLLREVFIDSDRRYYDTNLTDHHHLYFSDSGHLEDVQSNQIQISKFPDIPQGLKIDRMDMIIRVSKK
mgnify:FL=1